MMHVSRASLRPQHFRECQRLQANLHPCNLKKQLAETVMWDGRTRQPGSQIGSEEEEEEEDVLLIQPQSQCCSHPTEMIELWLQIRLFSLFIVMIMEINYSGGIHLLKLTSRRLVLCLSLFLSHFLLHFRGKNGTFYFTTFMWRLHLLVTLKMKVYKNVLTLCWYCVQLYVWDSINNR